MRFKEYTTSTKRPNVMYNYATGTNPILTVDSSGKVERKGRSKYNDPGDPIFSLENLQSRSYPDFYVLRTSSEKNPEVRVPCWRTEDDIYINAEVERIRLAGPPTKPSNYVFNFYIPEDHPLFNFDKFSKDMFFDMEDHIEIYEPEVQKKCSIPVLNRIFKLIKTNKPK